MTIPHLIEGVVLVVSILTVSIVVKNSNNKVKDLDGFETATSKDDTKGKIVAKM